MPITHEERDNKSCIKHLSMSDKNQIFDARNAEKVLHHRFDQGIIGFIWCRIESISMVKTTFGIIYFVDEVEMKCTRKFKKESLNTTNQPHVYLTRNFT